MKEFEVLFREKIHVTEIDENKWAIVFPMYKLGGEQYEIHLIRVDDKFYISDNGATHAELDKIFELEEPDVLKNLVAILRQFGCRKIGDCITIEVTPQDIHIKFSYLIQAISFMLNMKIFYI